MFLLCVLPNLGGDALPLATQQHAVGHRAARKARRALAEAQRTAKAVAKREAAVAQRERELAAAEVRSMRAGRGQPLTLDNQDVGHVWRADYATRVCAWSQARQRHSEEVAAVGVVLAVAVDAYVAPPPAAPPTATAVVNATYVI